MNGAAVSLTRMGIVKKLIIEAASRGKYQRGNCQRAWLQDDGGRFRELHEAHIARLAAESRLAEVQARLATASASAGQQVTLPIRLLGPQSAFQLLCCRRSTGACCIAISKMTPHAPGTRGTGKLTD